MLLIHGLSGTRRTRRHVIDSLSATHTVIAPDLPGHGQSNAPAGDYSLGAHAAALRDLMVDLGHPSTTVAGHSLGGGIALQFAYQFPSHTRRLLLISSGGLGPELSVLLRAATLPGASTVVAGLASLPARVTRNLFQTVILPGLLARQDAGPAAGLVRGLAGSRQRHAFLRTARSVVDWHGQTVSANRQLVLLTDIPVMIAWGDNDEPIPPDHHRALARQLPGPHVVEIANAGHHPHETAPGRAHLGHPRVPRLHHAVHLRRDPVARTPHPTLEPVIASNGTVTSGGIATGASRTGQRPRIRPRQR